jgi:hypothetical protein
MGSLRELRLRTECLMCRLASELVATTRIQKPELCLPNEDGDLICIIDRIKESPDAEIPARYRYPNHVRFQISVANYRRNSAHEITKLQPLAKMADEDAYYSFTQLLDLELHERARPLGPREADLRLLKSWIKLCEEQHGGDCSQPSWLRKGQEAPKLPREFRLIDVELRCVVPAPSTEARYYALSYVWGDVVPPLLMNANLKEFSVPGALDNIGVPRTVADAIGFVLRLGGRFLWVDSLCIIQDNPYDKLSQIYSMDLIYSYAFLTIVAAAGGDANAGLPGANPNSRVYQQKAINLAGTDYLTTSVCGGLWPEFYWNRRGWTYQERALS